MKTGDLAWVYVCSYIALGSICYVLWVKFARERQWSKFSQYFSGFWVGLLSPLVFVGIPMALWQASTGHGAVPGPQDVPGLSAADAKYEARKLLAVINGPTRAAAFIDQVLQNDAAYDAYFVQGLGGAIKAAPVDEPLFKPYISCLEAAKNLAKFAELRRLGQGQNDQSDEFRTPFWSALDTCEKVVGAAK